MEWSKGVKSWLWFVIIANLIATVYYLYQAYNIFKGIPDIVYTPQAILGLALLFVASPGLFLVNALLYMWLFHTKKKAALYGIIAWFLVGAGLALYGGDNPLAGLLGVLITYFCSRKVVS